MVRGAGVVDVSRCAHDELAGRSVGNGVRWVEDAGMLVTW